MSLAGAGIRRYMRVILDWNGVIACKIKRSEGLFYEVGRKRVDAGNNEAGGYAERLFLSLKTPGPGQLEVPKKERWLL